MRTVDAAILREPYAAVKRELGRLDLTDRGCEKPTKFQPLFFRYGCLQILDFGLMLSHEHNESH
ncbi:MAG: hypothetical protein WBQ61_07360, partial [Candidatus Acidiferrum sp.]